MKLNRPMKIGLTLLGVALLLFLFKAAFDRLSAPLAPPTQPPVANAPTGNQAQPASLASGGNHTYIAQQLIPARSILTREMFKEVATEEGGANSLQVTDFASQASGYITRDRPIFVGEKLQRNFLIGHLTEVGVAGAVRPGFRAMMVPIANKSTLHDLVKVGDFVDIVAAFDKEESRTIVQNARVLAVDVFGKDYPQTSIAQRGDFKAPPRQIRVANPASPNSNAGAPNQNPDSDGAEGQPQAAPTATAAPNNQPPPKPEPALTLEVTPQDATAISLAQAATAPLDFVLRPRAPFNTPEVRVAAVIKPQIAPYASRIRREPGRETATEASRSSRGTTRTVANDGGGRPRPANPVLPPLPIDRVPTFPRDPGSGAAPAETYQIPVYGDGKLVRVETVRKPQD